MSFKHVNTKKVSKKHSTILENAAPLINRLLRKFDIDIKKISLGKINIFGPKTKSITVTKLNPDNDLAIRVRFVSNGAQDLRIFLTDFCSLENVLNFLEKFSNKYGFNYKVINV